MRLWFFRLIEKHSVNTLQVKPPFAFIVGLPITHEIISPNCQASCRTRMPHHPTYSTVEGRVRFIPRAYGHAGTTRGTMLVSDPHAGTLLDVDRPALVTIVHDLSFIADSLYRAFTGTLLTF